jgi:hypothetical protein
MTFAYGFVLSMFGFYVTLGVILGLAGSSYNPSVQLNDVQHPTEVGIFDGISYFISSIGYTLGGLPSWANIILFLPLSITMGYLCVYLILELIPG